jgi:hypothetical protein
VGSIPSTGTISPNSWGVSENVPERSREELAVTLFVNPDRGGAVFVFVRDAYEFAGDFGICGSRGLRTTNVHEFDQVVVRLHGRAERQTHDS